MTSNQDPVYNSFKDDLVISFNKIDLGVKTFIITFPDTVSVTRDKLLYFINQEYVNMDYIFSVHFEHFKFLKHCYLDTKFIYPSQLYENNTIFDNKIAGPSFQQFFTIALYFYTLHYSEKGKYYLTNYNFSLAYIQQNRTFYSTILDRTNISKVTPVSFYKEIAPYIRKLCDVVDSHFYFTFNNPLSEGLDAIPVGLYQTPPYSKGTGPDPLLGCKDVYSRRETKFLWQ
jgi:hypothetical protein